MTCGRGYFHTGSAQRHAHRPECVQTNRHCCYFGSWRRFTKLCEEQRYQQSHCKPGIPDLTDSSSFVRLKFWVKELQNCEQQCKIYLCGTKSDLIEADRSIRQVDYHDAQDYAEEVKAEIFETSSKTGRNVDELFQKVAEDFHNSTAFQVMTGTTILLHKEREMDQRQRKSCCHH
ncbi:ras-related protein Rab-24-like isoform X3 [Anguilla rostrata]|uniref:ras-related protein Rab-24-like isoform X3 n=1 Tax=Anguilla rostrata TaxID=7938 RepID=UPI0030D60371